MSIPTFPSLPGVSWPVTRSPMWLTIAQDSWSGKSAPIQVWSYPRRKYELTFDILRSGSAFAELQTLEGFFNALGGSVGIFAFTDVDDQTAAGVQFGVGDGITTTFQLARPWGGFFEPVFAPRGALSIFVAGAVAGAYGIGANPGSIVFAVPPSAGAVLTWSGAFDWLCRFDDDTYDFTKFMSGLWSLGKIAFTTVKL